jgi:hypothetical protein
MPINASDKRRVLDWLEQQVLIGGRGDDRVSLDVDPSGLFWLGRLAPESAVLDMGLGDRGERLDPCAIGLVVNAAQAGPWSFTAEVHAVAWRRSAKTWTKSQRVRKTLKIVVPQCDYGEFEYGLEEFTDALATATTIAGLSGQVRVEVSPAEDGTAVLAILFVNTSPKKVEGSGEGNLYEVGLEIDGLQTVPFLLADLPDSFRYDRRVPAWGINCGVRADEGRIATTDTPRADLARPEYWGSDDEPPDLSFRRLASDPLPPLRNLAESIRRWGVEAWSVESREGRARADDWSPTAIAEAAEGANDFGRELGRIDQGLGLLETDGDLRRSFQLMNQAMQHSSAGKYDSWRAFQVGFLLANLGSLIDAAGESDVADIVWFATGGGKTETYLGLLVTAALHDRIRGKRSGITAWSRFPLRMLSLQQTQRFADAMAGAELARERAGLGGDPFSVGFFVGQNATPNQIVPEPKDGQFDPDDDEAAGKFQVLMRCPFCRSTEVEMVFNRREWKLEHRCTSESCPWPEQGLPFYIVDQEIFRFLPTVVVGTLDKAASIALQAAMRGFVGAPLGRCSEAGHGYTYAKRSGRPNGCLVAGCRGKEQQLEQAEELFGPSFRLQDELHLLRDSLGAVDAHYEAVLDSLQAEITGRRPKILASSATLTGYEKQVEVLYLRKGRVFPSPGPTSTRSFWSRDTDVLARRYVAIAPRGVTTEFAIDRIVTILQAAVRRLLNDPGAVSTEIGIDPGCMPTAIDLYGTDVVYGNTLRDLEAVRRSLETQVAVDGSLNVAQLTGQTDFDEVRSTLDRLDHPENEFGERLHVVAASSMMSHGVDIDRLNVMVMIGIPLTTAEFIQSTSRVGRTHPGLVFVLHKIARERDAGIYRSFPQFVTHANRLVEPIPITRRSRRVLQRTAAGIQMARIYALHEPRSHSALTLVSRLRDYFDDAGIDSSSEALAATEALRLNGPLDELMIETLAEWSAVFFQNLRDPTAGKEFPTRILPWMENGPMISLRDVEEQATIRD